MTSAHLIVPAPTPLHAVTPDAPPLARRLRRLAGAALLVTLALGAFDSHAAAPEPVTSSCEPERKMIIRCLDAADEVATTNRRLFLLVQALRLHRDVLEWTDLMRELESERAQHVALLRQAEDDRASRLAVENELVHSRARLLLDSASSDGFIVRQVRERQCSNRSGDGPTYIPCLFPGIFDVLVLMDRLREVSATLDDDPDPIAAAEAVKFIAADMAADALHIPREPHRGVILSRSGRSAAAWMAPVGVAAASGTGWLSAGPVAVFVHDLGSRTYDALY